MASSKQSSINLGIPPSPETTNPDLFPELIRIYNSLNILAEALDTFTGSVIPEESVWSNITANESYRAQNILVLYLKAAEDIPYGAVCTLDDSGAELVASLADATDDTRPGRCINTGGDILTGEYGRFNFPSSLVSVFSGLSRGSSYYLSTSPGLITLTAPSTPGNAIQPLGYAISPTQFLFCCPFSPTYEVIP